MKDLYEKYVNRNAEITLGGLQVNVVIKDVKVSWGKERFLVSPLSGAGSIWVESVTFEI